MGDQRLLLQGIVSSFYLNGGKMALGRTFFAYSKVLLHLRRKPKSGAFRADMPLPCRVLTSAVARRRRIDMMCAHDIIPSCKSASGSPHSLWLRAEDWKRKMEELSHQDRGKAMDKYRIQVIRLHGISLSTHASLMEKEGKFDMQLH